MSTARRRVPFMRAAGHAYAAEAGGVYRLSKTFRSRKVVIISNKAAGRVDDSLSCKWTSEDHTDVVVQIHGAAEAASVGSVKTSIGLSIKYAHVVS
eukprot:scaffold376732_cov14-Prasinocladus_malaysianus.AAC.1